METLFDQQRDCYVGETNKLIRNGFGVYQYKNNFFRYEGEWRNGKKQGHGKFLFGDKSFYEGEFENGEMTGHGARFWASSGNVYTGQVHKGELHGQGTMKYPDGSSYEGDWIRNIKHGQGVSINSAGDTYTGEFYQNHKQGEGVMVYSNGDSYEGYWVLDKRQGHGKWTSCDGSVYEGQFNKDLFNGEGNMHHSSGLFCQGIWINGKPEIIPSAFRLEVDSFEILQGQTIDLNLVINTDANEIMENESGREFRISAGFKHYPTEEGNALFDMIEDIEETPIETPFGYNMVPFPLTEKPDGLMTLDVDNLSSDQSESFQSVKESLKATISSTNENETNETLEKTTFDNFPAIQEPDIQIVRTTSPTPAQVSTARSEMGLVKWSNLLLPHAPPMYRPYAVIDQLANKTKSRRSSNSVDSKELSIDASPDDREPPKKDIRLLGNEKFARPGEYVIMIEDVTNPPFMGVTLSPVFAKVKLYAAPSPSDGLAPKKDEKRRSPIDIPERGKTFIIDNDGVPAMS